MAQLVDTFTRIESARLRARNLASREGQGGQALPIARDTWRPVGQQHAYTVEVQYDPCVYRLSPEEAEARRLQGLRSEHATLLQDAKAEDDYASELELKCGGGSFARQRRQRARDLRDKAAELARKEPTLAALLGAA